MWPAGNVFLSDEHGFESRPVVLGAANSDQVEIRAGIHPGELIVTQNSFRLKAALETGVGSGCSSPGHAH
jgi:multidrug efflux pump subunit AcrA (membrane-fusion protein)